jgi:23S rRNA (adenine2030-N6)-methyltransferase
MLSALFGAWAGATAAQRIAERSNKRTQLRSEIGNNNAGIILAFDICNAHLTAKSQHIAALKADFDRLRDDAREHFARGRGVYDLEGSEAKKTGEADSGIRKLLQGTDLPAMFESYVRLVRGFGPGRYPGSPLIAARMLRDRDRLVAIEKHPEECANLKAALSGDGRVRVICGDGYASLAKLVPPPERRGIVLIDPPYEAEDEFETATRALAQAYRRFATGVFLFWYPAKERTRVAAAAGELVTAGINELIRMDLDIGGAGDEGLTATGLLVANPPYGFAAEMGQAGAFLARRLGQGERAGYRSEILAGEG